MALGELEMDKITGDWTRDWPLTWTLRESGPEADGTRVKGNTPDVDVDTCGAITPLDTLTW